MTIKNQDNRNCLVLLFNTSDNVLRIKEVRRYANSGESLIPLLSAVVQSSA